MEYMSAEEFSKWLFNHRGERGRKPVYETVEVLDNPQRPNAGSHPERRQVGVEVTAMDGATLTLRRNPAITQGPGTAGPPDPGTPEYIVDSRMEDAPDKVTQRTPEQIRTDTATAAGKEQENAQRVREDAERSWNQTDPRGSGLPETHLERAKREADERKRKEDLDRQAEERRRQQEIDAARQRNEEADRAQRAADAAAQRGLTQQQIDIDRARFEREGNKPTFLSQADTKNQYVTAFNPQTGQIESYANPNYDAVKQAAEERRQEIATQIAQRQITLQEGQQQYKQWFDQNVQIPMMQAQEIRARAEERRQALDAEERRRQFAANYKLQKAQLGETAASRATSAEISLLPYRVGPTLGAEMPAAINSLAAGGKINGPDASAGVHFSPGAFSFNRPDFKAIAAEATKQAIGHLTDYRPSGESYAVGDYSNVPTIGSGPAYQYSPPAPPAEQ